jgi:hypothetical protein
LDGACSNRLIIFILRVEKRYVPEAAFHSQKLLFTARAAFHSQKLLLLLFTVKKRMRRVEWKNSDFLITISQICTYKSNSPPIHVYLYNWSEMSQQPCLSSLSPSHCEGFVQEGANLSEEEEHPEDEIPDLPENQAAREFLKTAPKKGLFMPLGKEVKVMQCWRCKAYGHR